MSTPLDSKTLLMMQDSGLSSQQTTHISEAANTPKAEITEMCVNVVILIPLVAV